MSNTKTYSKNFRRTLALNQECTITVKASSSAEAAELIKKKAGKNGAGLEKLWKPLDITTDDYDDSASITKDDVDIDQSEEKPFLSEKRSPVAKHKKEHSFTSKKKDKYDSGKYEVDTKDKRKEKEKRKDSSDYEYAHKVSIYSATSNNSVSDRSVSNRSDSERSHSDTERSHSDTERSHSDTERSHSGTEISYDVDRYESDAHSDANSYADSDAESDTDRNKKHKHKHYSSDNKKKKDHRKK